MPGRLLVRARPYAYIYTHARHEKICRTESAYSLILANGINFSSSVQRMLFDARRFAFAGSKSYAIEIDFACSIPPLSLVSCTIYIEFTSFARQQEATESDTTLRETSAINTNIAQISLWRRCFVARFARIAQITRQFSHFALARYRTSWIDRAFATPLRYRRVYALHDWIDRKRFDGCILPSTLCRLSSCLVTRRSSRECLVSSDSKESFRVNFPRGLIVKSAAAFDTTYDRNNVQGHFSMKFIADRDRLLTEAPHQGGEYTSRDCWQVVSKFRVFKREQFYYISTRFY